MNLFRRAQFSLLVAASRPTNRQQFIRQYASETNQEVRKEGFGSPVWRNTLIVCLIGFAWYHFDNYLTKHGEACQFPQKASRYRESSMTPDSEWNRITLNNLKYKITNAKENLLIKEARPPPMYRFAYPEQFELASPFLIEPGTDVDLSDLVVKTYEDDHSYSKVK
ncbi:9745_t:CDS:2 [Acaulospora morrowiae]|uniref:9745_t:CDS:1 n=1 Tax=Acaulospora morrowiae TaxID=94023 RepID=A0A9N9B6U1_9GLOM|nr:9745_t:CDS:2 [Acaulospora morrowiae]